MRVVRRALELVLGRVVELVLGVVLGGVLDLVPLRVVTIVAGLAPVGVIRGVRVVLARVPELAPELTQRRFNNAD